MQPLLRARSTNRFVKSPAYPRILAEYNAEFQRTNGKVNDKKFYENVIVPCVPNYTLQGWYGFLKRFRSETRGLIQAQPTNLAPANIPDLAEGELRQTLLTNDQATQKGITASLNIGAAFYEHLLKKFYETPDLLTQFEQKCLENSLFKAMKAQDSRVHALGKMKEDGREQAKFDRAFGNAAYGQ